MEDLSQHCAMHDPTNTQQSTVVVSVSTVRYVCKYSGMFCSACASPGFVAPGLEGLTRLNDLRTCAAKSGQLRSGARIVAGAPGWQTGPDSCRSRLETQWEMPLQTRSMGPPSLALAACLLLIGLRCVASIGLEGKDMFSQACPANLQHD